MCSIIASFSKDKIAELAELNAYRGQHSYSIAYYNTLSGYLDHLERGLGELPLDKIHIRKNHYCIVHQQAPTTEAKSRSAIHPAVQANGDGTYYLWHNGIIKQKEIERLQNLYQTSIDWDTALLLKHTIFESVPSDIDGTFSCLYFCDPGVFYLFRNEISPMFYDKYSNISSTKFEDSISLPPNIMWRFRPGEDPLLVKELTFTTVENPYWIT